MKSAGAGAVELAEEDALPAAEGEAGVFDKDGGAGADQRSFDVGVGVAFGVTIARVARHKAVESGFDIAGDVGVVSFVDGDARGGVRDVEMADAGGDARRGDERLDGRGDVEKLGAAPGFDVEGEEFGHGGTRMNTD